MVCVLGCCCFGSHLMHNCFSNLHFGHAMNSKTNGSDSIVALNSWHSDSTVDSNGDELDVRKIARKRKIDRFGGGRLVGGIRLVLDVCWQLMVFARIVEVEQVVAVSLILTVEHVRPVVVYVSLLKQQKCELEFDLMQFKSN